MIEDRADSLDTAGVVGRATELSEISRFLDGAQPSALVLEGEPGIGKTMLWQAGVDAAREREYQVLVCRPAEAEAKLGYAALGDLLEAVPDELFAGLDEPQRHALDIALLRSEAEGARADPRAVSLGLLNLLRSMAGVKTVIVAVDDVQWLDSASTRALEFAFRRLEDERVGLLASERVGESPLAYERLLAGRAKRSGVGPLDRDELDDLLRERWETPFDRHTTARIHRLSGGNPFYAHEIARSLGGQDDSLLDERLAVPPSLRALVAKRVAALRPPTRKALLAASALSAPTVPLIAAATGRRDDRAPALAEAEAAGVVEVEFGEVRFTHPLLAAAAYADAGPDDRRKLHRRLARIVAENEESARHLALAAERPNAKVADVLEAAAQSASSRGALDEAVTLGEQAWRLTPDDATRAQQRRQVDAAFYHLLAGDTDRARELGQEAAAAMPRGGVRARALLLLGSLEPNAGAARDLLHRALLETADDGLLARIESVLVANYMTEFDPANASVHAKAALEHAVRTNDPGLRASTLMDVAWSNFYRGHGLSPRLTEEALALEGFCDPTPVRRLPRMRYTLMLHLAHDLDGARSGYEALADRASGSR